MATVSLRASFAALVRITAAATVEAAPAVPGTLTLSTSAPRLAAATAGPRLTVTTSGGDA